MPRNRPPPAEETVWKAYCDEQVSSQNMEEPDNDSSGHKEVNQEQGFGTKELIKRDKKKQEDRLRKNEARKQRREKQRLLRLAEAEAMKAERLKRNVLAEAIRRNQPFQDLLSSVSPSNSSKPAQSSGVPTRSLFPIVEMPGIGNEEESGAVVVINISLQTLLGEQSQLPDGQDHPVVSKLFRFL